MKKYRVESRNNKGHSLIVDCYEDELEYYKALLKYDAINTNGKCYYREFPVTKNEKVYYSEKYLKMTVEELMILKSQYKQNMIKK